MATPARVDISNKLFLIKLFTLRFVFGFVLSSKVFCESTELRSMISKIISLLNTKTFLLEKQRRNPLIRFQFCLRAIVFFIIYNSIVKLFN